MTPQEPARASDRDPSPPKHEPGTSGFWWIPGGMLLTAAAAILAWWLWPPNAEVRGLASDEAAGTEQAPLPDYVLETDGGLDRERELTGTDGPPRHRYRRDTEFEWVLRPKLDGAGEVGVRGFAFVDGASVGLPLASLTELARVGEAGIVRITGTAEQLELEPGRYTIALAVGRPATLPSQATELAEPPADAAWQVRRLEIEIEG